MASLIVKFILYWMIERGLLGVLWMILVLWPALAAGFRPEGIEEDDDEILD